MQLRQRDILGNYAEKNGGTARIALLINSPLSAKLRGVLRKCGTGSHAPDRSIKIPRRQSPLCAIDQCIWADLKYFRLENQNITD